MPQTIGGGDYLGGSDDGETLARVYRAELASLDARIKALLNAESKARAAYTDCHTRWMGIKTTLDRVSGRREQLVELMEKEGITNE